MADELEGGSLLHKYRILGKAGEGTFSEVLKAVHVHTKKYVAIKRMKQKFQSVQQVNNLREVQALRRLNPHNHIIGLREIIFDRRVGSLSLVCELSDMNLYELIRSRTRPLPELKVQHLIYQLFLVQPNNWLPNFIPCHLIYRLFKLFVLEQFRRLKHRTCLTRI